MQERSRRIEFERYFKVLECSGDGAYIEYYNKRMKFIGRDTWKGVDVEEELEVLRSMGVK